MAPTPRQLFSHQGWACWTPWPTDLIPHWTAIHAATIRGKAGDPPPSRPCSSKAARSPRRRKTLSWPPLPTALSRSRPQSLRKACPRRAPRSRGGARRSAASPLQKLRADVTFLLLGRIGVGLSGSRKSLGWLAEAGGSAWRAVAAARLKLGGGSSSSSSSERRRRL